MFNKLNQQFEKLQFTRKKQQAFLEDLCVLIEDGVPLNQAVDTIRLVSDGATKMVATHIMTSISKGELLADGMQDWFQRPIIEVVRAGEMGGTLTRTLQAAATSLSLTTGTIGTLVSALVYPAIVVMLAFGVAVFVKCLVLDSFAQIKPVTQWPNAGRALYDLAYFTQHWWWALLIFIVLLVFSIVEMLKHLTGDSRKFVDTLPLLSLYREMMAARFMETLGLLIANGVILKKAISIMYRDAAPYLAWHLVNMEYRLSGGQDNIADVLDTDLIGKNDIIRLRVVAKGKGFSHALVSLGRQASQRSAKTIAVSGKILGTILLIGGASIAIMMVVGIYMVGSVIAS